MVDNHYPGHLLSDYCTQVPEADDYVVATGKTTTVREFCNLAFAHAGMPIKWEGSGLTEVARVASGEHAGRVVIRVSERYFRPAEVSLTCYTCYRYCS